jgi:hypothetical protein
VPSLEFLGAMTVLTPDFAAAAKQVATTAAPVTSGITVTQAIGIFVGIPALLVLLITAGVYATTRGSRRRQAAWSRRPVDHIGGARPSVDPAKAAGPAGADHATAPASAAARPADTGTEAGSLRPAEGESA